MFFFSLVAIALFTLNVGSPDIANLVLIQAAKNLGGIELTSGTGIFSSLLLLLVVGAVLRYFQLAVQIERNYLYIHALEKELSGNYPEGSPAFEREGKWYNDEYPLISTWFHKVYTVVFPVGLAVVAFANIFADLRGEEFSVFFVVNVSSFVILEIKIVLYLVFLRSLKTQNTQ